MIRQCPSKTSRNSLRLLSGLAWLVQIFAWKFSSHYPRPFRSRTTHSKTEVQTEYRFHTTEGEKQNVIGNNSLNEGKKRWMKNLDQSNRWRHVPNISTDSNSRENHGFFKDRTIKVNTFKNSLSSYMKVNLLFFSRKGERIIKIPITTKPLSKSTDLTQNRTTILDSTSHEKGSSTATVLESKKKKKKSATVRNVEQLQHIVLDKGVPLKDIQFDTPVVRSLTSNVFRNNRNNTKLRSKNQEVTFTFDHPVLQLIQYRMETQSLPGARAKNDTAVLALSIEGGGMRGAVSAGMASAIACLGLSDAFDSIYGSSAGSVIGAYLVSRQMCIDVYTDLLTTAKTAFVCKKRLLAWIGSSILDSILNQTMDSYNSMWEISRRIASQGTFEDNTILFSRNETFSASSEESVLRKTYIPKLANNVDPGMNISFVLDGIMSPNTGLRPLDMEAFQLNDKKQPLRIVASTLREGKLETTCFGSKEMDFFDAIEDGVVKEHATSSSGIVKTPRHGLFACLQASMTVPAATGPPVSLIRNKDRAKGITTAAFDAFCFEPIPYRSAVHEGATHVLVLRSRPADAPIGTQPTLYESSVAPLYFNANNMPTVSKFFQQGGQQYIYVEDYLTLEMGKKNINSEKGVLVPPPRLLYGVDLDTKMKEDLIKHRKDTWKRAHILPVVLPDDTPELPTLSVDKYEVLQAVRDGFAVAFDMLAPAAGVHFSRHLNGRRVAELIFPDRSVETDILKNPVFIVGRPIRTADHANISPDKATARKNLTRWIRDKGRIVLRKKYISRNHASRSPLTANGRYDNTEKQRASLNAACPETDADIVLSTLPGFKQGCNTSLARGLEYWRATKQG